MRVKFYRPHCHRGHDDGISLLDRSLQAWLIDHNHHCLNHGDDMAGRTPVQAKKHLRLGVRQTAP